MLAEPCQGSAGAAQIGLKIKVAPRGEGTTLESPALECSAEDETWPTHARMKYPQLIIVGLSFT